MSPSSYGTGIAAYVRVLAAHRGFRTLWLGELLNSAGERRERRRGPNYSVFSPNTFPVLSSFLLSLGGWFAYVATLRRVAELAPPAAQGRLLAAVLATHYLPGLFLFPLAGVLADRAPRELVLAGACGLGALSAAALTLVRGPGDLGLMLGLLVLQFSATTVYEPTRRSLTPSLVPPGEALRLATTLDSVGWSIMSAAGASAGGAVLGRWGYGVCYAVDAATYAAAGLCALSLHGLVVRGGGGGGDGGGGGAGGGGGGSGGSGEQAGKRASVELVRRSEKARRSDASEAGDGAQAPAAPPPPSTSLSAAFAAAVADVRAGFAYVAAHRPILVLACVKAAGSTVWGAADLVNTYVSEQAGAQASAAAARGAWARLVGKVGVPSPTPDALAASVLGAIFACVGVGCFVGPLISNALIPSPRPSALMRGIAGAFACLSAGYVGIALSSTRLGGLLVSTGVRAAGSSILWAYSTLLLQTAVPDALLGRVCSLEQAAFVTGECVSALAAAWMFDVARVSVATVAAVMAGVAAAVTGGWWAYCRRLEAESGGEGGHEHGHRHRHERSSDDAEAGGAGGAPSTPTWKAVPDSSTGMARSGSPRWRPPAADASTVS